LGELKNFTGIDSDYEKPGSAEIKLDTLVYSPEMLADQVINYLKENNKI
jgi:adenylylsulfate kinase-like enzyme